MKNTLPTYTGLKDFARGVQNLYKLHGDIPVFIGVAGEDHVAPFGIAIQQSSLLGGNAIVLKAGPMRSPNCFTNEGTIFSNRKVPGGIH